jgi:hypothetical protein
MSDNLKIIYIGLLVAKKPYKKYDKYLLYAAERGISSINMQSPSKIRKVYATKY